MLPTFLNVQNSSLLHTCISDYFAESQINSQTCVVDLLKHQSEELEVIKKMDFFFFVSAKTRSRIFSKAGDKHGLRAPMA